MPSTGWRRTVRALADTARGAVATAPVRRGSLRAQRAYSLDVRSSMPPTSTPRAIAASSNTRPWIQPIGTDPSCARAAYEGRSLRPPSFQTSRRASRAGQIRCGWEVAPSLRGGPACFYGDVMKGRGSPERLKVLHESQRLVAGRGRDRSGNAAWRHGRRWRRGIDAAQVSSRCARWVLALGRASGRSVSTGDYELGNGVERDGDQAGRLAAREAEAQGAAFLRVHPVQRGFGGACGLGTDSSGVAPKRWRTASSPMQSDPSSSRVSRPAMGPACGPCVDSRSSALRMPGTRLAGPRAS